MQDNDTGRRPRRLRTITPPPPVDGWAQEIVSLEEAGAELALVFWQILRKVRAWAETPPQERGGLFDINKKAARERLPYVCAHAPDLIEAFGTFALMVRVPGEIERRQIAEACRQVSAWAEEHCLLDAAMLYAEAGAIVDSEDPNLANLAGRLCRRAARDERAASWYYRAFGLAARKRSRVDAIWALLGYGSLMYGLGRHAEARTFYERAARRAISAGRLGKAAAAHHDLLLMCAETGAFKEAERHTRQALRFYSRRNPAVPAFGHDFAFLLVRQCFYSRAIALLDLVLPRVQRPEVQTVVWSTLARAAGGARRRDRYDEAAQKVLHLVGLYEEFAAAALVNIADGARAFGEWSRAGQYAKMAVEVAQRRKDAEPERVALSLLEKITDREPMPPEEPADEKIRSLSDRVAAKVRQWRAPDGRSSGAIPTVEDQPGGGGL